MTPLPAPLGAECVAWRLDQSIHAATWDSGQGAAIAGGRWNRVGTHAVYCALDPATAILEVAVHVGFDDLDGVARTLTSATILMPDLIRVVAPVDVPNPNWLSPGRPSARQQAFGDSLLSAHGMIALPSAVSQRSWNLVFLAGRAPGTYVLRGQERFALDTRLASATVSAGAGLG